MAEVKEVTIFPQLFEQPLHLPLLPLTTTRYFFIHTIIIIPAHHKAPLKGKRKVNLT
jgi:hypothetical protein